jgi:regulatory protein
MKNCCLLLNFMYKQTLTKEQALQKAKHYCGYQERSHSEVKEKLYSYQLRKAEVEELISRLIDEDYLNEERFAIQFAGGRFRMKQWGKVKITYELKQKKVSEYCIKKAMKEIDEAEYEKTLLKLFAEKQKSLKGETNHLIRKRKLQDYLLQKGYEFSLVQDLLRNTSRLED